MDHVRRNGGAAADKLHGKDVQIRGSAWRPRLEKIIDKQIGAEIFEKLHEAQAGFVDDLLENRHEDGNGHGDYRRRWLDSSRCDNDGKRMPCLDSGGGGKR
nr:hypothetical protein Iba_chr08cCG10620 [Ipomoea batatas]